MRSGIIDRHKKLIKRAATLILAATAAVSVSAGLIRNAVSYTNYGTGYTSNSKKEDVTLLIGNGNELWSEDPQNVSEVSEAAKKKYLLGLASQFSIFTKAQVVTHGSDTEGRAATGGGFYFDGGDYNYSVGAGHYVEGSDSIPLDGLLEINDYADVIVGGGFLQNVGLDNNLVTFPSEDNVNMSSLFVWDGDGKAKNIKYDKLEENGRSDLKDSIIYGAELIDFGSEFDFLKTRSMELSSKSSDTSVSIEGNTVTFDGKRAGLILDAITFDISAEDWAKISSVSGDVTFDFINIPELSEIRKGVETKKDESGNIIQTEDSWNYSYIVVNVEGTKVEFPSSNFCTKINGKQISRDEDAILNNNLGCTSLLYNFSQATELKLGKNFQGTILAPNADVTDHGADAYGHLSGALIANSFDGYTEFGYRPYTGPIEILKSKAYYNIVFNKIDSAGNPLSGAVFELYSYDGEKEEQIKEITSDEMGSILTDISVGKYIIREKTPLEGYILPDKEIRFEITEKSDKSNVTLDKQVIRTVASGDILDTDMILEEHKDYPEFSINTFAWSTGTCYNITDAWATIYYTDGTAAGVDISKNNLEWKNENWIETPIPEGIRKDGIQKVQITINQSEYDDENIFIVQLADGSYTGIPVTLSKALNGNNAYYDQSYITSYTVMRTEPCTEEISYVSECGIKIYDDWNTFKEYKGSAADLRSNTYFADGTEYSFYNEQDGAIADHDGYELVKLDGGEYDYLVIKNGAVINPTVDLSDLFSDSISDDISIVNYSPSLTLQKVKDDKSTILSGATLELYKSDDTFVQKWENFDGETDVFKDIGCILEPGEYYFSETKAPDGYMIPADNKMRFTVKADYSIESACGNIIVETDENYSEKNMLKIVNSSVDTGTLKIKKSWIDRSGNEIDEPRDTAGNKIESIVFKIYRTYDGTSISDGEEVGTLTVAGGENWSAEYSGLPLTDSDGKKYYYYITEEIPVGYISEAEVQPKSLDKDNIVEFTAVNKLNMAVMPETGGTGTMLFVITGLLIMGTAAYIYVVNQKNKAEMNSEVEL